MAARSLAFPWPRARGYGLFTTRPHSHGPFTVTRKMAQGAGAGMLDSFRRKWFVKRRQYYCRAI